MPAGSGAVIIAPLAVCQRSQRKFTTCGRIIKVLHHIIRVAFEACALRRSFKLDGPLLMNRQLDVLLPFWRGSPPASDCFGSVALSMPLGLIFGRPDPPLSRAISSR